MWKIWNYRKVWTVCAPNGEWVEFEHFPNSQTNDTLETLLKLKRQAHPEKVAGVDYADIISIEARLNKAIKSWRFKL